MAKNNAAWQTVTIKPLSGALDTRSTPEDVPLGSWRYKQNMMMKSGSTLCVRPGWEKLFAAADPYTNYDLHDQGSLALPTPDREPPNVIFAAQNNAGAHFLYVATSTRIYVVDEATGIWTTIASGLTTATQARFKAAQLQEKIIFTNNVDQPQGVTVGTPSAGPIPDLVSLGIKAAGVVVNFGAFMMLMDVNEGGLRHSSRIWWSDENLPFAWGIGGSSLSNFQDLDYGDAILAAVPMAGSLYIFTQSAIWKCNPTGDALTVFAFTKVYGEPKAQAKCLVYPNTLVSLGNSVIYASHESFYEFSPYVPEPTRDEWLYRGAALMFQGSGRATPACCQTPSAEARPLSDESNNDTDLEYWVSWPENPLDCVNSKTLVINTKYKSVDIVDFGFHTFSNYRPSVDDSDQCKSTNPLFIGASAGDDSLKSIGPIYSREVLTNPTGQGTIVEGEYVPFTGEYAYVGYYSILRMMLPFVNYDRDKIIRNLLLEVHAEDSAANNVIRMRVGNSFSESDPNLPDQKCAVLWHRLADRPLKCLDTMTPAQYVAANLIRNTGTNWPMLVRGRFLYFEVTIAAANGDPAIGAAACFTRAEWQTQLQPVTDY